MKYFLILLIFIWTSALLVNSNALDEDSDPNVIVDENLKNIIPEDIQEFMNKQRQEIMNQPSDVVVNSSGDKIYVLYSLKNQIQVLDSNGNHLKTFGSEGTSNGEFDYPSDIAVDSTDNRVYVVDTYNHRIQVFDSDGNHKLTFGSEGGDDVEFNNPVDIAINSIGDRVYVADSGNNRIQVFDSNGDPQFVIGVDDIDGQVEFPKGITTSSVDNTIYVADSGNNRIQVFDSNGNHLQTFGSEDKFDVKENEGGGCLIATAAYGSEMSPQVQILREIRDGKVMNTQSGASFMTGFNSLYYSFSPYIADYQRENPVFKEIVKIGITPMLSTLSIMSLADTESGIVGYGIGVILLNLGMYVAAPAIVGIKISRHVKSKK